jgi:hypothetical protein
LSCNCEDILNKELCDVPYEWRSQIVKAICLVQDYDYECEKNCQSITFLSKFRNELNQICISYIDENKETVNRCFDYDLTATILNDLILPDCIPLPSGVSFENLNFDEKFQHIVDILCKNCCGIPCNTPTLTGTIVTSTTTTTTSVPSTTTSTTVNCCQGGGFHALPLPSGPSIISNGVTISSSFTVPSTPQSLIRWSSSTKCPACYACGNYETQLATAVPVSTPFGPTHPWDYILNFSQPIKSINLRILNFSSTEHFDIPTQTWIDASLEGLEFTTNVGNPTITLCEGCFVNVQGNKIYSESAIIGHTGVKNGSGIFRISSNTPFSSLKITDVRIFTNSTICYYCGPDYYSSLSFDMCGQVTI